MVPMAFWRKFEVPRYQMALAMLHDTSSMCSSHFSFFIVFPRARECPLPVFTALRLPVCCGPAPLRRMRFLKLKICMLCNFFPGLVPVKPLSCTFCIFFVIGTSVFHCRWHSPCVSIDTPVRTEPITLLVFAVRLVNP